MKQDYILNMHKNVIFRNRNRSIKQIFKIGNLYLNYFLIADYKYVSRKVTTV